MEGIQPPAPTPTPPDEPSPAVRPLRIHRFEAAEPLALAARRRVVVTGLGIVAPSGVGPEALWTLLLSGESAVRPVDGFDVSGYPVRIAAQVPDFRPRDFMRAAEARRRSRFCQLATAATRLAAEDATVAARQLASPRTGLFLGTSAGAIQVGERQAARFHARGLPGVVPTFPFAVSPHSAAAEGAYEFGIAGPVVTVCSDCASGADAIAAAYRQIAAGLLDAALAGGADAPISPMLFGAFARSGMLAPGDGAPARACRPFDQRRAGWVVAEGGVMLVLEHAETAAARGARIYGEVVGAGSGRDRPTYIGDVDPSGRGFLIAARQALAEAGLRPGDIGHVNAHAPGVPTTDLAEARALQALLGERRHAVAVTSIKGALGQPLGAAGALQLASALLVLERGWLPVTANCEEVDPECDLDVVRGRPRPSRPRTVLVTSHGFTGNTTCLLIQPWMASRS